MGFLKTEKDKYQRRYCGCHKLTPLFLDLLQIPIGYGFLLERPLTQSIVFNLFAEKVSIEYSLNLQGEVSK